MLVDLGLYLPDASESLAEAGPFGASRSGALRIAERVGYELVLEPGSVAGRGGGTTFAAAARGATTNFDVLTAFSASAHEIIAMLSAEEREDAADEERIAAIFLTGLATLEGVLALEVTVVTAAGGVAKQSLTVEIPPEE